MPGQQFTPEQRNWLAMAYKRKKEHFKFMTAIKVEFGSQNELYNTIILKRSTLKSLEIPWNSLKSLDI